MVEDEPQYDVVLKKVLWDESRESIFQRLKVNGVEGARAEKIYAAARVERIRTIQQDGMKALLLGCVGIVLALVIYFFFKLDELNAMEFGDGVNGTAVLPWLLGFVAAVFGAFGLWKVTQGLTEILFAGMKKGSIADR